jgi:TorA maturation chaperone TorD
MMTNSEQALLLIAWSQIWSPLIDEQARARAWQALELPDTYAEHKAAYWSTFHVGAPQPSVPTLLHAALQRDGASTREDWTRVITWLDLRWNDRYLPPDQLGVACELCACAMDREESALVGMLAQRYLVPWCDSARQLLAQGEPPLRQVVLAFSRDMQQLQSATDSGAA